MNSAHYIGALVMIIELEKKIINANDVIQGAIRKLNFFMNQYDVRDRIHLFYLLFLIL